MPNILTNLFSGDEPEQSKPPEQLQASAQQQGLSKSQLKIERLDRELQAAQKELAQTKAQLQIHQGFQIELGETQLRLQQADIELQRYKKDLFEQQKKFSVVQTQHHQAEQNLAQLTQSQNWLNQIKTPITITEINKTLPKKDFETLWGFGILSPASETTITTGAIFVRGWVLGKKAQAKQIGVKYQDESLLLAPVKLRRPVVAQQYPDIPAASNSGFEFTLSVAGITTEIELNIEALLEDETVISLCNFVLQPQTIESNDT